MGMFSRNSSSRRVSIDTKNPDPSRWHIIKSETVGRVLICEVLYPNAKNFEGRKLMMFKPGVTLEQLVNKQRLDPHFRKAEHDKDGYPPMVRLIPTEAGWVMARILANALDGA